MSNRYFLHESSFYITRHLKHTCLGAMPLYQLLFHGLNCHPWASAGGATYVISPLGEFAIMTRVCLARSVETNPYLTLTERSRVIKPDIWIQRLSNRPNDVCSCRFQSLDGI